MTCFGERKNVYRALSFLGTEIVTCNVMTDKHTNTNPALEFSLNLRKLMLKLAKV